MSIIIPPIVPKVPPLELEDGTAVAILYQGEAIGIVTENSDLDLSTDFYFWDEGASRTDYTPSEDDNVLVQGVSSDPNGFGYFGYSYYQENQDQLKAIAIDNGQGAVAPTVETVRDGSYQPLSRQVYIYVNAAA